MGLFDWFRKSTPEHTPAATAPAAPSTDVLTAERGTVEETPVSPAAADLSGTWSIGFVGASNSTSFVSSCANACSALLRSL
mgnify:CR=1 FL=1